MRHKSAILCRPFEGRKDVQSCCVQLDLSDYERNCCEMFPTYANKCRKASRTWPASTCRVDPHEALRLTAQAIPFLEISIIMQLHYSLQSNASKIGWGCDGCCPRVKADGYTLITACRCTSWRMDTLYASDNKRSSCRITVCNFSRPNAKRAAGVESTIMMSIHDIRNTPTFHAF